MIKVFELNLLPVCTFFTVEGSDSEFADFILPTLKTFLKACSQPKNGTKTLFPTLHPLSMVIFATATVLAFVLLCDSRFNFHCYTQREAEPTQ